MTTSVSCSFPSSKPWRRCTPYYVVRALAGVLFLLGGLVMVYNMWRTARGDVRTEAKLGAAVTAVA